ncbi:pectin lyase-like protein [Pseudovirgaria hyperparasitica]|uniref:Pectin lyase-like protein n=1 Tax=Pseudovirgaria hyperparasitica TaxID=470096 RepID=A0A6A6VUZ1_9PEZI|nr:pectin lyase-like protein [Pseudovirgaria hyperparasitica]KAF2753985.1 pectin lyase-like protein [Pseudovirgaria hyperparasitica]
MSMGNETYSWRARPYLVLSLIFGYSLHCSLNTTKITLLYLLVFFSLSRSFTVLYSTTAGIVAGQLSGTVGPLTSIATKSATKTCNVLDYGAKADKTIDLGPPLVSAFADCKTGGVVIIPAGDYALETWASLSGGSKWALQLDGTIHRTGTDGGNMIFIQHTSDFEMFSSTSKGAVQGNGYEIHAQGSMSGARILRLFKVSDFSVHDIALTDAPSFHFSLDTCTNGEVYNMAIRGGDAGGLDGIDVWSENIHIHDIEVTNKDECVTVKSPAHNILIESIYCNRSGGCAMGSLGADTNISNIHYRNIYTWASNQMFMLKSHGGSGSVSNIALEAFIGHANAYSLDIDQYWASISAASGAGVAVSNLSVSAWRGTAANALQRGPVKIVCADGAPCVDVAVSDFAMWTEIGDAATHVCRSAYGAGACLAGDGAGVSDAYDAVTSTLTAAPSGYVVPSMEANLQNGFGTSLSIPVPTIPTSFYPGVTPLRPLVGASVETGGDVGKEVVSSSAVSSAFSMSVSPLSSAGGLASSVVGVLPTPGPVSSGALKPSNSTLLTPTLGLPGSTPGATPTRVGCQHQGYGHGHGHGHGHAHSHVRRFSPRG